MAKVWKLAKWTKNREALYKAYTATLRDAQNREIPGKPAKAILLANLFFPKPAEADLRDLHNYHYPEPILFMNIEDHEITNAIKGEPIAKAPSDDNIDNRFLVARLPSLAPYPKQLFEACPKKGYCPKQFRKTATVALRQPKRETYSIPKSYRTIALLSIIGKAVESIVANRRAWAAETYNLLPNLHFGGRKGISSEAAMYTLIGKIHVGWEEKLTSSLLLLDVSGAFENVSHQRLLHNLRKRKIGGTMLSWIDSFISDREVKLLLPDYTTGWMKTGTGIPRGSPISPILYLFYNADFIDRLNSDDSISTGYIDYVATLVTGDSPEGNARRLAELHEGALEWSKIHTSIFDPKKYQLVDFHPDKKPKIHH